MKIFRERKINIGTDEERWEKREQCDNLEKAQSKKVSGERIHICHHDEDKNRPCEII